MTPRQREVLELIARGLSNADIAGVLGISPNTVKVHVASLLKALDVTNRTEAVFIHEQMMRAERQSAGPGSARPPVAVLGFDVDGASAEAAQRTLAEDLSARLATWRWFPVLSAGATAHLDAAQPDYEALAQLGAIYAVTGRISTAGAQVRVQAELLSVASREQLWAERFDASSDNLFVALDAITLSFAGQAGAELLKLDASVPKPAGFETWTLASRAMALVHEATRPANTQALELAQAAIDADSTLRIAWYARGAALYQRMFHQWTDDPRGDLERFIATAEHCVDLDSDDSACQELCGFARLVVGDFDAAIVHLTRAVELNPGNAQAYSELGQTLTFAEREEDGIDALRQALAIAPRGESAWSAWSGIALAKFLLSQFGEAVDAQRHAITFDPSATVSRAFLAAFLAAGGQTDEAATERQRLLRDEPDFKVVPILASFKRMGKRRAQRFQDAFAAAGFEKR